MIRPMRPDDVAEAERLSDTAFRAVEGQTSLSLGRSAARAERWRERTAHFLTTDPGGCWVAEADGAMAGFATSYRRDLTWILATYTVLPRLQGMGLGKALLDAALTHGRHCLRGMLSASLDAKAFRRYRAAGFSLHPMTELTGRVDRSAIPEIRHVREATAGDVDLMDSIDRRVRDAAHGPDHPLMHRHHRPLVVDDTTGSGYAYVDLETGEPLLLAATNTRTATRLLWAAVADAAAADEWTIPHVTAPNEWAVDVGLAVGLSPRPAGYLAVRGMKPPAPYLHHATFL